MSLRETMALGELCQRCGLCCDGTLFQRVPVGIDEAVPELALQLATNARGARFIPQRCSALEGSVCQVYAQRPLACQLFQCLLFGALAEGEVSSAEADVVVQRARELVALARADSARVPERDEYLTFHFGRRR